MKKEEKKTNIMFIPEEEKPKEVKNDINFYTGI